MTISSTSNKAQFNGNGGTTAFPFTFKTFVQGDLDIILTSVIGVETTKTITTHYTVDLNSDQNNNPGGTVTMLTAPATGEKLTILRNVDALQETDITNGGGFYPEVMENALDRATMLVQQNAEELARAVKVPVSSGDDPDDYLVSITASVATATTQAGLATTAKNDAVTAQGLAEDAQAAAELAAAALPNVSGGADTVPVINGTATGWLFKTAAQMLSFIGGASLAGSVSQAFSAASIELGHASDTTFTRVSAGVAAIEGKTVAMLSAAETFTAPQRGTLTTDNDGSFDQSVTNNFFCTPTGAAALTFTNHTAGQSGLILFVNSSNYAITAAATTYIAAADLVKLSATGTYVCSYISNGTNTYVVVSAALTSAGV